jgi:hypothetical protein
MTRLLLPNGALPSQGIARFHLFADAVIQKSTENVQQKYRRRGKAKLFDFPAEFA